MLSFLKKLKTAARRLAGSLAASEGGGLAVTFAFALPVVVGALGIAVDLITLNKVKADLQAAADSAAVAGAREIQLARSDQKQVTSAARSYAAFTLTGDPAATAQKLQEANLAVGASVVNNFTAVKVDITESWTPFFAHFIASDITPVTVTATARFVGSNNICVLGLSRTTKAVFLDKNARLTGNDCGAFSNSADADGMSIDSGAVLKTSLNCSAGGVNVNSAATVSPRALSGCPEVPDPLASRPAPAVGGCDHRDMVIKDQSLTLAPGVYCGGLLVTGTSEVKLNPGIYIIQDGQLGVTGKAVLRGEGVSFFITGSSAGKVIFAQMTQIELAAPDSGPMAGLLFYEDRAITQHLRHQISSDNARRLVGTLYFPSGDLIVDAKNPVADQSAWTAIIVHHLELNMGPNLILNSDYSATSIPVPEGIKGSSQVVLTQ